MGCRPDGAAEQHIFLKATNTASRGVKIVGADVILANKNGAIVQARQSASVSVVFRNRCRRSTNGRA